MARHNYTVSTSNGEIDIVVFPFQQKKEGVIDPDRRVFVCSFPVKTERERGTLWQRLMGLIRKKQQ